MTTKDDDNPHERPPYSGGENREHRVVRLGGFAILAITLLSLAQLQYSSSTKSISTIFGGPREKDARPKSIVVSFPAIRKAPRSSAPVASPAPPQAPTYTHVVAYARKDLKDKILSPLPAGHSYKEIHITDDYDCSEYGVHGIKSGHDFLCLKTLCALRAAKALNASLVKIDDDMELVDTSFSSILERLSQFDYGGCGDGADLFNFRVRYHYNYGGLYFVRRELLAAMTIPQKCVPGFPEDTMVGLLVNEASLDTISISGRKDVNFTGVFHHRRNPNKRERYCFDFR